jgi:hypothetical protein
VPASEMSVSCRGTVRRCNPEDLSLYRRRRNGLKTRIFNFILICNWISNPPPNSYNRYHINHILVTYFMKGKFLITFLPDFKFFPPEI